MSTLKNRVQLIGHLGIDPEMKTLENGSKRVSFRLATNESYQQNGEWKENAQWHQIVAWNRTAERAEQYLEKGSYVLVEGKLVHRSYVNSDGVQRYITEIQVRNFIILDKKTEDASQIQKESQPAFIEDEVDLPF